MRLPANRGARHRWRRDRANARAPSLGRPPDVGQMAGPEAPDQHGIEANRVRGVARMAGEEEARRARDAAELPAGERVRRLDDVGTRLHLDEGQYAPAADHDVDLAQLGLVAPRQDRVAGEPQPPYRAPLRNMAQPIGRLACFRGHGTTSRLSSRARA